MTSWDLNIARIVVFTGILINSLVFSTRRILDFVMNCSASRLFKEVS
jgi:hypothetical protein